MKKTENKKRKFLIEWLLREAATYACLLGLSSDAFVKQAKQAADDMGVSK